VCTKGGVHEGRDAHRTVRKTYQLPSSVRYCESCDRYHVVVEPDRWWNRTRWRDILQYIAQGYRDPEIAPLVKMSAKGVECAVLEITKRLNAMSRPNLVAIAICLGILDPNEFVPAVDEKAHGRSAKNPPHVHA